MHVKQSEAVCNGGSSRSSWLDKVGWMIEELSWSLQNFIG